MSIFSLHAFDDHEMVAFGRDAASGLRCIVAIHNTVRGPALGGTRMWNYETEHQAITDALRLSRGMTYKAAVANLPYGGGKAVIFGDPRTQKTEALLRAYGRFVESLGGLYDVAYEGSGISQDEVLKSVAGIGDTLMDIFARADAASVATNVVADRIAEARFTPRDSRDLAA